MLVKKLITFSVMSLFYLVNIILWTGIFALTACSSSSVIRPISSPLSSLEISNAQSGISAKDSERNSTPLSTSPNNTPPGQISSSSTSMENNSTNGNLYSDGFLKEIQQIKTLHKEDNREETLNKLNALENSYLGLTPKTPNFVPNEKAYILNLKGVIKFSAGNYDQASIDFTTASNTNASDKVLLSQIEINLASCYYKQNRYQEALNVINKINLTGLNAQEIAKYNRLRTATAQHLGIPPATFNANNVNTPSNTVILGNKEINLFKIGIVFPFSGEKSRFSEQAMAGIDTGYQEWLKSKKNSENITFYTRDSMGNGVVGSAAVKELVNKYSVSIIIGGLFSEEAQKEYLAAKNLGVFFISLSPIYLPKKEKDFLLLEIPGPVESQVERLLSKDVLAKFGSRMAVMYPDDNRGQAYLNQIWDSVNADKLNPHEGQSSPNTSAIGSISKVPTQFKITNVQSYAKSQNDYRRQVSNILGLGLERERQEEIDLISRINAAKSRHGHRSNAASLSPPPVIDFDWVFIPAYPDEALKLIPTFRYYDATKLVFIGGPSWRGQSLAKLSERIPLYFIGESFNPVEEEHFKNLFYSIHKRWPKLIEMVAYNASKVLTTTLYRITQDSSITSNHTPVNTPNTSSNNTPSNISLRESNINRSEFITSIQKMGKIEGIGGDWILRENTWHKEMELLKLVRGKVERVNF